MVATRVFRGHWLDEARNQKKSPGFGEGAHFTAAEASRLVEQPVKAGLGLTVPQGTRGHVAEFRRALGGWVIAVAWDGIHGVEWFTKTEASRSLRMVAAA